MRLQNLVNPRRTRIQRMAVVAFVVFVGVLLTQAMWPSTPLVLALAAGIWALLGSVAANYLLEGKPW